MRNNLLIFLIFMCTCMGSRLQAQESPVKLAGMHGGLCVYFDATESQITEVVNSGSFLVHALQRDEKGVALIRKAISASGQAPLVSIDAWTTAPEIPYKRNHINLAVANSFSDLMKVGVTIEKLVEVLSPLGKACLGGIPESAQAKVEAELKAAGVSAMEWKGSWLVFQKPWLEGMGTWTHRQRGPDGNAVGNDTYLGVPNQIQWITSGS